MVCSLGARCTELMLWWMKPIIETEAKENLLWKALALFLKTCHLISKRVAAVVQKEVEAELAWFWQLLCNLSYFSKGTGPAMCRLVFFRRRLYLGINWEIINNLSYIFLLSLHLFCTITVSIIIIHSTQQATLCLK